MGLTKFAIALLVSAQALRLAQKPSRCSTRLHSNAAPAEEIERADVLTGVPGVTGVRILACAHRLLDADAKVATTHGRSARGTVPPRCAGELARAHVRQCERGGHAERPDK